MTSDGTRRRDARRPGLDPEMRAGAWGVLHAVLAFALEVGALGAFWYAGSRLAPGAGGLIIGFLAAALFVAVWAMFLAPRARRRIPWPWRPVVALALFVLAGAWLLALAQWAGAALIVVALADTVLGYWLRRRD